MMFFVPRYLKLGRFRLQLTPNPFINASSFRQELKVKEGYIEIESLSEEVQNTFVKLWVEVDNPVVHIDIESDDEIEVVAAYESWRTEDKELLDVKDGTRERFTCFNLEGYPGKVIRVKDEIDFYNDGVLLYHRNPKQYSPDSIR